MATAKQRAWRAKFARMYGGGRKKKLRSRARVATRTRTRSYTMARRSYRRKSRGGFGGGQKIFGLGTKGLIGGLGIAGVLAGIFFKDQIAAYIPINLPMKDKLVAFALGGPAGAVGAFAKDAFMPSLGSSSSWGY